MQADVVTKMTIHRDLARSDLSDCLAIIWVTEEHHCGTDQDVSAKSIEVQGQGPE